MARSPPRPLLVVVRLLHVVAGAAAAEPHGALTIPVLSGELATPEQLHRALAPAWDSLVESRNAAGLVGPKDEGKPQPPLSEEETAMQFARVQQGQVDSARLLLVFGLVPSVSQLEAETLELFEGEREAREAREAGEAERPEAPQTALVAGVDQTRRYADGSTALHYAASLGVESVALALLQAGADVAAVAATGLQPIHAAAITGHVALVELLISHRADPNARHGFAGSTALHFATEMGHPAVVRRLCELGADPEAQKAQGGTALHVAADTNNAAAASVLLEHCGADPEAVLLGDTAPLYLAAGRGFAPVIDVLLAAGANPDRTLWPDRPWHKPKRKKASPSAAAAAAEGAALQRVAEAGGWLPGSHPSAPGWEEGNGATALHNAAENGHLAAVEALLEGGARQLATMEGVTPLIISLQYRHPAIASALLDHAAAPANVAVANPKDGQTALHVAAAYDYPEVVARLLRDGAAPAARDRRGHTALDYARGPLCRFLLARFQGREPALDRLALALPSGQWPEAFAAAARADKAAVALYTKFAGQKEAETLQDNVARLARLLQDDKLSNAQRDRLLQKFAVGRFLLAGGDTATAIEAMLRKDAAGMHAGLVLLRVPVRTLQYEPGKSVNVNGHEVHALVNQLVHAAMRSSQGDTSVDLDASVAALVEHVRRAADPGGEAAGDAHLEL